MTDKELRRLSRGELLEMLIAQTEENRQLKSGWSVRRRSSGIAE